MLTVTCIHCSLPVWCQKKEERAVRSGHDAIFLTCLEYMVNLVLLSRLRCAVARLFSCSEEKIKKSQTFVGLSKL